MKGLSVEPGERRPCVPLTWPSIWWLCQSAEPMSARTSIVEASSSRALALIRPTSERVRRYCCRTRSIVVCMRRSMVLRMSCVLRSCASSMSVRCGARNGRLPRDWADSTSSASGARLRAVGSRSDQRASSRWRAACSSVLRPRSAMRLTGFCGITASVSASGSVNCAAFF